jgi:hypothetical protein
VIVVLDEFFTRTDDGYRHKRCDEEVARYHEKQEKARSSANARWAKSERNANAMRTHSEGNALQTPDTSLKSKKKNLLGDEPPEWVEIRSIFPKRKGDHRWPKALIFARARLRDGHTWAEMLAGARRYAAFVRAEGKEHTPYVKQAATFFSEKAFVEPWVTTKKADPYANAI